MAAIYMWLEDISVLTSTLYPIEVDSGVAFSGAVISGAMREWVEDELEGSVTFLSASVALFIPLNPRARLSAFFLKIIAIKRMNGGKISITR